jgi:hypothetical protein
VGISLNYTSFANSTSNSYENTIIVKYANSKKIFNFKTSNILLNKNLSILFGFSVGRFPSVRTKRLLFRTSSAFCYVKSKHKLSRSNRTRRLIAQHFKPNKGIVFSKKANARLKSYVLHPYFTNFELDLYKTF